MSGPAAIFTTHARGATTARPSEKEKVIMERMAGELETITWQFNLLHSETANAVLKRASEEKIQVNFFDILHLAKVLRAIAERGA